MEVWTILKNAERGLSVPVRIMVSGTLEEARLVAKALGYYFVCRDLYYVEGDTE